MCVWVFWLHVCTHTVCIWYLRTSEGVGASGTIFMGDWKLLWGFWELNPGPLKEQEILLTMQPSLRSLHINFKKDIYFKRREMVRWLRVSSSFAEDPSSVLSTHNYLYVQLQRDHTSSSGPSGTYTHLHILPHRYTFISIIKRNVWLMHIYMYVNARVAVRTGLEFAKRLKRPLCSPWDIKASA